MAVGTFQKTGVAVTGQFRYGLLVDATVQQGGDKEVAQGVQVILSREAVGSVYLPQAFGERIGMDERPIRVDEQVGTELPAMSCGLLCQPPAVTEQHTAQGRRENDLAAVTVFGTALHHTLSSHDTAGAADGKNESVAAGAEV